MAQQQATVAVLPPNVGGVDSHGPWVGGAPDSSDRLATVNQQPVKIFC